jgi:hypothetical protein
MYIIRHQNSTNPSDERSLLQIGAWHILQQYQRTLNLFSRQFAKSQGGLFSDSGCRVSFSIGPFPSPKSIVF